MNGIIQVKFIGGFGNNLHQYAAARKYAETVGAKFETLDWSGKEVFRLPEELWSRELPEVDERYFEWGQTNMCLSGFFQTQRWAGILSRAELRRWLVIRSELLDACPVRGGSYVAAHLRQGDYIGNPFYANVPLRSYVRACAEYGLDEIDRWVAQDAPCKVEALPHYLNFLPDFVALVRASTLLRANSTFSWWAAALGDGDVYAPVVTDHVGEYDADFVRGNWPMIAGHERCGVDDLHLPE